MSGAEEELDWTKFDEVYNEIESGDFCEAIKISKFRNCVTARTAQKEPAKE